MRTSPPPGRHHQLRRILTFVQILVLLGASIACSTNDRSNPSAPTADGSTTSGLSDDQRPAGARPSPGCGRKAAADATAVRSLSIGQQTRTYSITDSGTNPDRPTPLVVLLHGMGMTSSQIAQTTRLPEVAEEAGIIVAIPQALGSPTLWQPMAGGPDAEFLDAMLRDIGDQQCIDESRVHLAGFSVGAALASVYSCSHQDQVASLVTVSVDAPADCTEPMSILAFHSTDDPVVPYGPAATAEDIPGTGTGTGTEANLARWAANAHCDAAPSITKIGTETSRLEWSGCAPGTEVVLYRTAGGHIWPTATTAADGTPTGIDASDLAITFVQRHQQQGSR